MGVGVEVGVGAGGGKGGGGGANSRAARCRINRSTLKNGGAGGREGVEGDGRA